MLILHHILARTAIATSILAAAPLLAEDCKGARAILHGGYTLNFGMGDMIYRQELHLERYAAGLYGDWTGTFHKQTSIFPPPAKTVAAAPSAIPGVKATCTTTTPNSQAVEIACTGKYPFTLHKDWTITWTGQKTVIGTFAAGDPGKPGEMSIDMLEGAPGYAQAKAIGMTGEVSGKVFTTLTGKLEVSVAPSGGSLLNLPSASRYTFSASMLPEKANLAADVVLTAAEAGATKPGAKILPTADPSVIDVVFWGGSPVSRLKQAEDITLTATASLGGCIEVTSLNVGALMIAEARQP